MRTIHSILHVQTFTDKRGKKHARTYALIEDELGNLEEAQGYGTDFKVGDRVEFFYDSQWMQVKFRKTYPQK